MRSFCSASGSHVDAAASTTFQSIFSPTMLRQLSSRLIQQQRVVIKMAEAASASAPAAEVHIEAKLASLGYKLPVAAKPAANYIMCKRVGNMIYTGESAERCTLVKSD